MIRCYNCNEEYQLYYYYILKKYKIEDGEERSIGARKFCSEDCIEEFRRNGSDDSREFFNTSPDERIRMYEMSRCVGYYDCERLDNIREMCEDREEKTLQRVSRPDIGIVSMPTAMDLSRAMAPECSPGEVGIIKASIQLIDSIEQFDYKMREINASILENSRVNTLVNQEMLKNIQEVSKINNKMYENTVASEKINKEILNHTKYVKWFTILLLIATVINAAIIFYQVFIMPK